MRQLIAGNWKMHGLAARLPEIEAIYLASTQFVADILIFPSATLIARGDHGSRPDRDRRSASHPGAIRRGW
jgi:triosephosphate isomerase